MEMVDIYYVYILATLFYEEMYDKYR